MISAFVTNLSKFGIFRRVGNYFFTEFTSHFLSFTFSSQVIGIKNSSCTDIDELGESLERRLESITKDEFMNLLDIEEITNSKNWKRPTGKWTRRGTNNKSFVEIAEELIETIRTNRKTSKYWRAASR